VYAAGTFQRSQVWSSELTVWLDTIKKSPEKYRPWTWLGKVYNDSGQHRKAIEAWERAEKLVKHGTHDHAIILSNLGLAYASINDRAQATEYYRRALEIRPKYPMFWANLAVNQMRMDRAAEAWASFENAVRFGRRRPEVYRLRGQELFQVGRYEEAAADFRRALEIRPEDEVARKNLAAAEAMARRQQNR
jgi:tetratricopeptide (TPR) repeat protein